MEHHLKSVETQISFLKDLPTEEIEFISPQMIRHKQICFKTNKTGNYHRQEIFKLLKQKYSWKKTHKYDEVQQILYQYFEFVINPAYKKLESLPIPIFVCGHCKEAFSNRFEYLFHCSQMGCSIKHERSTFFVCFKDTSYLIGNKDLQKIFSQNGITSQKYEFFGKPLYFANYILTPKKIENLNKKSAFICGRCNYYQKNNFQLFIRHCFGPCDSFKHQMTSHEFKILENLQSKEDFIKDILNLCLNYNILALFDNSYIKLKKNLQFKTAKLSGDECFCSNCQTRFQNQEQFLAHCLFNCKQRPNNSSSYLLYQKKCTLAALKVERTASKKYIFVTKSVLKENKLNSSKDRKWSNIYEKINTRYEKIWQGYENIYFCASCFNFYHELGVYLAHFKISQCTLNHGNNSHFLLDEKKERLTIEKLPKYTEEEDIQFLYQNGQAFNEIRLSSKLDLINFGTGKRFSQAQPSLCGKCGRNQKWRLYTYIGHIMKKCKCSDHPLNSFQIVYKHRYVIPYEIQNCLKNIQLCLQILKISPSTNLFIFSNDDFKQLQTMNTKNKFYCGKCEFLIDNKYEFYLHYLTKCEGLNSPNSSHFFKSPQTNHNRFRSDGFQILREYKNSWAAYCRKHSSIRRFTFQKSVVASNEQKTFSQKKLQKVSEQNEDQKSQISSIKHSKSSHFHVEKDQISLNKLDSKDEIKMSFNQNEFKPDEYLEIYPNFEFDTEKRSEIKFYCGKCDLSFRKKQVFVDHIFTCLSFYNPKSSHFILTLEQYRNLNLNGILNAININQNCQDSYPSYIQNLKNIVCGCGATKILGLNSHFSNIHSGVIPKGTSHFVIRLKIFKRRDPIQIYLPIEPKSQNQKDKFICPCDPFKKLVYRDFANHIIKKHEGKSPIFYMKTNNSSGQKMETN